MKMDKTRIRYEELAFYKTKVFFFPKTNVGFKGER